EVDLAPPRGLVPAGAVIAGDGEPLVAQQFLVDPRLAVAALLLGVVGLLGAEGLHEQGPLQAACQRHRQHLGREQRGERARRTPQRRHPDGVPFGLPQEPLDNVPEPGLVRGVGVNLACRAQHWLPPPQTLSLSRPAIAISLATSFSLYPL